MEHGAGKKDHVLAISILIAAFVIGGSFIYGSGVRGGAGSLVGDDETIPGESTLANLTADDDVILGDIEAPVTLIEFGDYQCPFCKRMFDEVEVQIRDEYIATGKVKMVYRDFPLDKPDAAGRILHPFARAAAEAAECARDEGKYWAYHDVLFTRQSEIPTLDFVAVASELGLDEDTFRSCVATRKYKTEVEKDYEDGIAAGVTGTPATFINGKLISGALPYASFKAAIDQALASL